MDQSVKADGLVAQGSSVKVTVSLGIKVPKLEGDQAAIKKALEALELSVKFYEESNEEVAAGEIIRVTTSDGEKVIPGTTGVAFKSTLYVYISTGPEVPTTEEPTTEEPTTEEPTTEEPTTEAPTTEAPTTEAPTTEAPTTEAPTTEASTTAELTPENGDSSESSSEVTEN